MNSLDDQEEHAGLLVSDQAEVILQQLTQEEKVALLSGNGMWEAGGVPRLGLPPLRVTDGPNGARGLSLHGAEGAALAPCHSALAATFNEALITDVGELLGQECADRGAHVLLAPTLNIHRSPITGRHFECFSEDPYLTSRAAVAYVRGVQRHAAACAKHFVGNDQEADRGHSNSVVDERTLHEVYLLPFEAAVREASVQAIMPGYNRLNGAYCAENPQLIQEVLRSMWGFKGFVISDWWANRTTLESLNAGLNLEMPGIEPRFFGGHLLEKVRAGKVESDLLDERVKPLLRTLLAYPRESSGSASPASWAKRGALLRRAAQESLVLLKNEGNALPLRGATADRPQGLRRLAIIGPNATHTTLQGGGSSRVHCSASPSILEALRAALAGSEVELRHEQGCPVGKRPFSNPELEGLKRMGACDSTGQPIERHMEVKFLDCVLGVAAYTSGKEWFRARVVPVLRHFGLRHTDPGEAGKSLISGEWGSSTQQGVQRSSGAALRLKGALGGAGVSSAASLCIGALGGPTLLVPMAVAGAAFGLLAGETVSRRADQAQREEEQALNAAEALAADSDASVLVVGTDGFWECEGVDQPHMRLPGRQDELVRRCAAAAAAAGRPVIVVLNVGSPKELPWLSEVPAVLLSYFGGEGAADAVVSTLLGDVSPAGKLPTTWPRCLEEASAVAAALAAERLTADEAPRGTQGDVTYHEGLHLGYRGLDNLPAPVFHFGHGLSYTSFEYSNFQVKLLASPAAEAGVARASATLKVRNGGATSGAEVVQIYASATGTPRALRGFRRTTILAPGEVASVTIELDERALGGYYDATVKGWVPPKKGTQVHLEAASSSCDVRLATALQL
eukprot:TRINITY_DN23402_c0_g1_i2.p1 TRINITY_DN23402_c0_g1~~TRINITY_DN23402_c0_g1_i2.p1  ORF type:complete len:852 (-),score=171.38 TRINITY_DN23402_c0_g1_i2:3-2558(-)